MSDYIVEMEHINKSFSGVMALNDVSFHLKPGEVMALLGENGAGKSTLMKILSGVYTRDAGTVRVFGQEVGDLTPKQAQGMGIAIIHQELNMCAHLSVAENIFLGKEIVRSGLLAERDMKRKAQEVLDRLKIKLDPNTVVGDLAVSKQQMVEIAKALSANARVLIMDEPTSALTDNEITELFDIIHSLKADGCGIVYISHRLEELKQIVDSVTIMRDGRYITSGSFDSMTMDDIITGMVGREIKEQFPRVSCPRGEKILEVKHLNAGRMVRDVSFDLYAGEILGIAGLMGAGRTETTRAIFGAEPRDSGEILLDGKPLDIERPRDAIHAGIVLVPEDRKRDGLCTKLSISDNITLPNLDIVCPIMNVIRRWTESEMVSRTVHDLAIKLADINMDAGGLSGGNQQKVVVGKWLARHSRVIIFDEPTRGIDVAAKVEIYNLMNRLKQEGIGVLFVSSEMPEIIGISDRILVMCDGRISGELAANDATQEKILKFATSFEDRLNAVPA